MRIVNARKRTKEANVRELMKDHKGQAIQKFGGVTVNTLGSLD